MSSKPSVYIACRRSSFSRKGMGCYSREAMDFHETCCSMCAWAISSESCTVYFCKAPKHSLHGSMGCASKGLSSRRLLSQRVEHAHSHLSCRHHDLIPLAPFDIAPASPKSFQTRLQPSKKSCAQQIPKPLNSVVAHASSRYLQAFFICSFVSVVFNILLECTAREMVGKRGHRYNSRL